MRAMATVGFVNDEGCAALVFLDEESGDVIEIQRSDHFDAQDIAFGMDTYCVVRSGAAHYGGVVGWRLQDTVLTLELSWGASETLGLPQAVSIPIDGDGAGIVRSQLALLLT